MLSIRQSALTEIIAGCPLRAAYNFGLGRDPLDVPTHAALFTGSQFHLVAEAAHRHFIDTGTNLDLTDLLDILHDNWDARKVADGERPVTEVNWADKSEGRHYTDAIAAVQAWYTWHLEHPVSAAEVPLKRDFKVGEARIQVTTRADAITADGTYWDWKTARTFWDKRLNRWRQTDYTASTVVTKPQPRIVLLLAGTVAPFSYLVVGKGEEVIIQEVSVPLTKDNLTAWRDLTMKPALEDVVAGRFPAKPGPFCGWCDVRKAGICKVV